MSSELSCFFKHNWYKCPLPLTIFISSILLFIYSLYISSKISYLLTNKNYDQLISYDIKSSTLMYNYIWNNILIFVSLIIILFFLGKLLPNNILSLFLNRYFLLFSSIFILITTSITINTFQNIKNYDNHIIITLSIISLLISLLLIIFTFYIIGIDLYNNSHKISHKSKQIQLKQF